MDGRTRELVLARAGGVLAARGWVARVVVFVGEGRSCEVWRCVDRDGLIGDAKGSTNIHVDK